MNVAHLDPKQLYWPSMLCDNSCSQVCWLLIQKFRTSWNNLTNTNTNAAALLFLCTECTLHAFAPNMNSGLLLARHHQHARAGPSKSSPTNNHSKEPVFVGACVLLGAVCALITPEIQRRENYPFRNVHVCINANFTCPRPIHSGYGTPCVPPYLHMGS